jgi:uncharacterized protein (DUF2235 family)
MPKNIVIFSDGTGQRSGLLFDENRTNIYKLYRATRCGPDSPINPEEQIAFYDAGLGTSPNGKTSWWRWLYNFICKATGLGLTSNIIDCYAEIIRTWNPGDRIFLFGFSRGAYTVRCLASVLGFCGIPTRMKDYTPLNRSLSAVKKIAREAVTKVYQHVTSVTEDPLYVQQRAALAQRFRKQYLSANDGKPNASPYFIGVFDTVASLAEPGFLAAAIGIVSVLVLAICAFIWWWFGSDFWLSFLVVLGVSAALVFIVLGVTHAKFAFGLEGHPFWKTFHLSRFRFEHYDKELSLDVLYVRHAIAIDEHRASFDRVRWGRMNQWPIRAKTEPAWLKQVWFAGNHSDIGGSFPENESRLSDEALEWMRDEARALGLKLDDAVLHAFPSSSGMQHDACKTLPFRLFPKITRSIKNAAALHPSVLTRFEQTEVLHYDTMRPYRPDSLRDHDQCMHFYQADELIAAYGPDALIEAKERAARPADQENKKPGGFWERVITEIERRSGRGANDHTRA